MVVTAYIATCNGKADIEPRELVQLSKSGEDVDVYSAIVENGLSDNTYVLIGKGLLYNNDWTNDDTISFIEWE